MSGGRWEFQASAEGWGVVAVFAVGVVVGLVAGAWLL